MVTVISLATVVVSLVLVAWQTRQMVVQTQISTQVAIASAGDTAMTLLHGTFSVFLDKPDLRPYFYSGVQCPSGDRGQLVESLAELLADCVNYGLEVAEALPDAAESLAGFDDYGDFLLRNSPTIARLVRDHPVWYPCLAKQLRKVEDEAAADPGLRAAPSAGDEPQRRMPVD